ncbi:hypothetical protein [Candidatus Arsenophonus triatominarum]|uniref:hypothetical protein n=1 Tax=Candidatus Arsenophonus triatominarum TaxID=57911 RepID=UPI0007C594D6|nr:hypothetical protein [Candidatus Arsenophonus triatominarum]
MKEEHSYDLLYFVKNEFKFESNNIDKVRKEHGKFGRVCFISTQKRDKKELLEYCAETYLYNHSDNSIKTIYLIAFDLHDICIGSGFV